MATWAAGDIALARKVFDLYKQSETFEQFENAASELMKDYENALKAKLNANIADGYSEILRCAGGNADLLARCLYEQALNRPVRTPQATVAIKAQKARGKGRPPSIWGEDGAGKLMVFFSIEEQLRKMRERGVASPKIRDAIARICGIQSDHRERPRNMAIINSYASRYSEVKKILKIRSE
ncbi:MAG: hypothetical protein NT123_23630 [Proteobacteria bacterium]|nr:hypothetical protein [Pseudomonadota bacterium]